MEGKSGLPRKKKLLGDRLQDRLSSRKINSETQIRRLCVCVWFVVQKWCDKCFLRFHAYLPPNVCKTIMFLLFFLSFFILPPLLLFLSTAELEFKSRNGSLRLAEENVRLSACALRGNKAMDSRLSEMYYHTSRVKVLLICVKTWNLKISVQALECSL